MFCPPNKNYLSPHTKLKGLIEIPKESSSSDSITPELISKGYPCTSGCEK